MNIFEGAELKFIARYGFLVKQPDIIYFAGRGEKDSDHSITDITIIKTASLDAINLWTHEDGHQISVYNKTEVGVTLYYHDVEAAIYAFHSLAGIISKHTL